MDGKKISYAGTAADESEKEIITTETSIAQPLTTRIDLEKAAGDTSPQLSDQQPTVPAFNQENIID